MRWCIIIMLALFSNLVSANSPDELFAQANEAYAASDFEKAIKLYERLVGAEYESAELEYNLANAYFRVNDMGRAILHYERALKIDPNSSDAVYNLTIAQSRISPIEPLPAFFLVAWWRNVRSTFSSIVWGILAISCFWLSAAAFYFWFFGKNRSQKKSGFFAGVTLVIIGILPLSMALNKASIEKDSQEAIVLVVGTQLKSAPDSDGADLLSLQAGHKVKLLDQISGWWQVELPNGEKGWLNQTDLEKI